MAQNQLSNDTVTAQDVFGKSHQVSVSELSWRPSVYGIVIDDGKVLLSPQFGDKFDLPGGGVDLGEDLEAAVMREVKEETGIDVEVIKLVTVKSSLFASVHGDGKTYHSILIYYLCNKVGGKISDEGFDEYEKQYAGLAQWVSLSEVDTINIASTLDYRPIVKEAMQ